MAASVIDYATEAMIRSAQANVQALEAKSTALHATLAELLLHEDVTDYLKYCDEVTLVKVDAGGERDRIILVNANTNIRAVH